MLLISPSYSCSPTYNIKCKLQILHCHQTLAGESLAHRIAIFLCWDVEIFSLVGQITGESSTMNGHCGNEKTINSLSRLKIGFDIEISDNQPWSDHLLKMESAPQVLFLLCQMLELDQEVVADSTNLLISISTSCWWH